MVNDCDVLALELYAFLEFWHIRKDASGYFGAYDLNPTARVYNWNILSSLFTQAHTVFETILEKIKDLQWARSKL